MTVFVDDLIDLVRAFDQSRPRSRQTAVGWSEVGGCRSYLGYRLDGAWPSDQTDSWGAVRGTAIHMLLEHILASVPGFRSEVDTTYQGIPGHADLVVIGDDSVTDFKSTKLANSRLWQSSPDALWQKRVQAHGYAAGLVDAGELPADCKVRLLFIPVDGTFADWWMWEETFDRSVADAGADRLADVRRRQAAGEPLPKDMPWNWCREWCPFFSLCREPTAPEGEQITDPELVAAVARYGELAQKIGGLYKDKDRLAETVRGLNGIAGEWRISLSKPGQPKPVLDEEAIRWDYAMRGVPVPVTERPGAAPRLSVTRLRRKAAA